MKLIYIPKYQNEKVPFKITQIIQKVIVNEQIDGLIFLPGYMSCTQSRIHNFVAEIQKLGVTNKTILLFNGMNGFVHLSSQKSIRQEHLIQYGQNNKIINFNQKKNVKDHRKMLFFFKEHTLLSKNFNQIIDDYKSFLLSITVVGMLIGSSNQSFSTYFSTAQKGEADLLMLHDSASFNNYQLESGENEKNDKNTVIMAFSNSISDTDKYFKNILRDIFENSL